MTKTTYALTDAHGSIFIQRTTTGTYVAATVIRFTDGTCAINAFHKSLVAADKAAATENAEIAKVEAAGGQMITQCPFTGRTGQDAQRWTYGRKAISEGHTGECWDQQTLRGGYVQRRCFQAIDPSRPVFVAQKCEVWTLNQDGPTMDPEAPATEKGYPAPVDWGTASKMVLDAMADDEDHAGQVAIVAPFMGRGPLHGTPVVYWFTEDAVDKAYQALCATWTEDHVWLFDTGSQEGAWEGHMNNLAAGMVDLFKTEGAEVTRRAIVVNNPNLTMDQCADLLNRVAALATPATANLTAKCATCHRKSQPTVCAFCIDGDTYLPEARDDYQDANQVADALASVVNAVMGNRGWAEVIYGPAAKVSIFGDGPYQADAIVKLEGIEEDTTMSMAQHIITAAEVQGFTFEPIGVYTIGIYGPATGQPEPERDPARVEVDGDAWTVSTVLQMVQDGQVVTGVVDIAGTPYRVSSLVYGGTLKFMLWLDSNQPAGTVMFQAGSALPVPFRNARVAEALKDRIMAHLEAAVAASADDQKGR